MTNGIEIAKVEHCLRADDPAVTSENLDLWREPVDLISTTAGAFRQRFGKTAVNLAVKSQIAECLTDIISAVSELSYQRGFDAGVAYTELEEGEI